MWAAAAPGSCPDRRDYSWRCSWRDRSCCPSWSCSTANRADCCRRCSSNCSSPSTVASFRFALSTNSNCSTICLIYCSNYGNSCLYLYVWAMPEGERECEEELLESRRNIFPITFSQPPTPHPPPTLPSNCNFNFLYLYTIHVFLYIYIDSRSVAVINVGKQPSKWSRRHLQLWPNGRKLPTIERRQFYRNCNGQLKL